MPIFELNRKISNRLKYPGLYSFKEYKINTDKKLNHVKRDLVLLKLEMKINNIIASLKPEKSAYWIGGFKSFLFSFAAVIMFLGIFMESKDVIKDLSLMKSETVYAKTQIEYGIAAIKDENIKNAKNRFYLAFDSLYNLSSRSGFFSNLVINTYGKLINFSKTDLDETIRAFDNISITATRTANNLVLFKNEGYLYKAELLKNSFHEIDANLNKVNAKVSKIKTQYLPKKYKEQLETYKIKLDEAREITSKVYLASSIAVDLFGKNNKERILFLFQNANEIRATGGFMGSYAIAEFYKGKLVNYEVPGGGIYDLRAGVRNVTEPPMPFKFMVDRWYIQDSNWFFDFNKSANKITSLFEEADRASIDSVIAINSNMMSDIMDLVGDIKLDNYNTVLNRYNVIDEIQKIISSKRDKTNTPKVVIKDLFKIISDKILNEQNFDLQKSYKIFDNAVNAKQIQIYSKRKSTQDNVVKLGASGYIASSKKGEDYLAIVETNINGGKTSQYIERKVIEDIQILSNGEIIKTLKIQKEYKKSNTEFDGKNIEFMRVYVPEGSSLISVYGFSDDIVLNDKIYAIDEKDSDLKNLNELYIKDSNTNTIIYNDEGKTIFGNFLYLNPGEKKEVVLKYKLPFKFSNLSKLQDYKIIFDKQSGIENEKNVINFTNKDINILLDGKTVKNASFILNENKSIIFQVKKK